MSMTTLDCHLAVEIESVLSSFFLDQVESLGVLTSARMPENGLT